MGEFKLLLEAEEITALKMLAVSSGVSAQKIARDAVRAVLRGHSTNANTEPALGSSLDTKNLIKKLMSIQKAATDLISEIGEHQTGTTHGRPAGDAEFVGFERLKEEVERISRRAGTDFEGGVAGAAGAAKNVGERTKKRPR